MSHALKLTAGAVAAFFLFTTMATEPGQASQQKRKRMTQRERDAMSGMFVFNEGGAVGCPNGALSGRTARVAEELRANGTTCEAAEAAPTAKPKPAVTAAWLVGTWALERCTAPEFVKRIHADGRYRANSELGTWRLSPEQRLLTLSFRREGDAPDRDARVHALSVARDAAGRLQLNIGWWVRCSRNPNAPIQ